MKFLVLFFLVLAGFIGFLIFGSHGVLKLVRWRGWPVDALAIAAAVCLMLTAIFFLAWKIGFDEDSRARIKEIQKQLP